MVIVGEFNAKSSKWGDPGDDRMGYSLTDFIASVNLLACNSGDKPTFERAYRKGMSTSHIDITLVTELNKRDLKNWRVLKIYSMNPHKYIVFKVQPVSGQPTRTNPDSRWAERKLDRKKLFAFLEIFELQTVNTAEEEATNLSKYLDITKFMPKESYKGGKKPLYWESQEFAELRRECLQARRKLKRGRLKGLPGQRDTIGVEYKTARKHLTTAIKRRKQKCWRKLCDQVETDHWGLPYKLVTKKLMGRRSIPEFTLLSRIEHIVSTLFSTMEVPI